MYFKQPLPPSVNLMMLHRPSLPPIRKKTIPKIVMLINFEVRLPFLSYYLKRFISTIYDELHMPILSTIACEAFRMDLGIRVY